MIHFSSTGNGDLSEVWWPASIGHVNAISGIDASGSRWVAQPGVFGSNHGDFVFASAPAANIFTTDRMGSAGYVSSGAANYALVDGTSYASPFAAGAAALIISSRPDLSADAVETIICETATDLGPPGWDPEYGCGVINAASAIAYSSEVVFIDNFEAGDHRWWSGVQQ